MSEAERDSESGPSTERVPPLNLSAEEAHILWEIVKVGIGTEEIHELDHEAAESVHTKVKELVDDD